MRLLYEPGTLLLGHVPFWGQTERMWVRILRVKPDTAFIRVTPASGESHTEVWVKISELRFASRTGLLELAPTKISCPAECSGQMSVVQAKTQGRATRVWICNICDEVIEV